MPPNGGATSCAPSRHGCGRQERDRAQREREEKARRKKGIDRARAWAAEHPEERQQARERYKQKHPDAYKQAQRDYYYRNRDAIAERRRAREAADPEKANEARRRAVERARAAGRDPAWSPTPDQRATHRVVFFDDPAGNHIELSAEMERFWDDSVIYAARRWDPTPHSVNMWGGQTPAWRRTSETRESVTA
ncbi:MAG TPA: hypothetical protein VNT50_09810 [Microbacterium sp.]|uniref:hypothetical protein n=1 Tax=Microbacterium sp. TaxID=51671 RepID=UPI002BB2944B|nr:hypothetical protein [Microbacterium sp.]HWI31775.1 hypothetical protein [Microbacterium sp.]